MASFKTSTRFPRAFREPPRRACGSPLDALFHPGVSNTRSNQLCVLKEKTAGSSYSKPYLIIVYSSCFFSVLINGWKKYATLLPKNRLAKAPQTLALMRLGRQSAKRERIYEINSIFF
ncbi:hypothetical protein [Peribacillus frigoritolerans]